MSFIKVIIGYRKYHSIKLIESIALDKPDSGLFYFLPKDQFLCKHLEKIQKVVDFKKYSKEKKSLFYPDYLDYLDQNFNFKFNGYQLPSEQDYAEYCRLNFQQINQIYDNHSECEICSKIIERKEIKKRKKLSLNEMCSISHDLGACITNTKIQKNYQISKTTLSNFKQRLRNKLLNKNKRKNSESSLSTTNKKEILDLIKNQPLIFDNVFKIKRYLNLHCHVQTIRNFLNRQEFKKHLLEETLYLNETNKYLKEKFCELVKDLNPDDWHQVVFTDEKIIQSFNNGKFTAYRMRYNKKKGRGFDKR